MRIDGEAIAADCRLDESKDRSYSYTSGQEKEDDDKNERTTSTTTNITNTTYFSSCQFPGGTTKSAVEARTITVQVALTHGTTKPHDLSPKALAKFQRLDH